MKTKLLKRLRRKANARIQVIPHMFKQDFYYIWVGSTTNDAASWRAILESERSSENSGIIYLKPDAIETAHRLRNTYISCCINKLKFKINK